MKSYRKERWFSYSVEKGFRKLYASGGEMFGRERDSRRARTGQYNANEGYHIPFSLNGYVILGQSLNPNIFTSL